MNEKKQTDLTQSTSTIFRVLFNLDTQSAITAALFVSLLTVAGSFFIKLCNYVYWYPYFTRFRIPMAYFDDAIIPETGFVYTVAILVPIALLWWWGLRKLNTSFDKWLTARLPATEKRQRLRESLLTWICIAFMLILLFLDIFLLEIVPEGFPYLLTGMLIVESGMFTGLQIFRLNLKHDYRISEKGYLVIRILAVMFLLYAILGGMYFSGHGENFWDIDTQVLKTVNEPRIDVTAMEDGEEVTVELVLLETADYYYVSHATLRKSGDSLYMQVWDDDTYRFIDKTDRPVKSVNAHLWQSDRDSQTVYDTLYLLYMILCILGGILFMGLFALPKKETAADAPGNEAPQVNVLR